MICDSTPAPPEGVIIDDSDNDFSVFKKSAELQGVAVRRVLVPVVQTEDSDRAIAGCEVANVFARMAGRSQWDLVDVPDREPISLDVVYKLRDALAREHVSSLVVVSAAFRSRRSEMIYRSVLAERGMTIGCVPVSTGMLPENWTRSWHGIDDVTLQFAKLQYYRLWVMPFVR